MNRAMNAFFEAPGRRAAWAAAVILVGCGGKAVVDPGQGGGGSGGTTTTPTSSSSSSSGSSSSGSGGSSSSSSSGTGGGPTDCATLYATFDAALQQAMACNSCDNGPDPCDYLSGPKLTDQCGCPVAVNMGNAAAVSTALETYAAWVNAGCGPMECGQPCGISADPTCSEAGPNCQGSCGMYWY
jgi:hypothetical protein